MIANRGLYMGGSVNGVAAGVGHAKPVGYGTYGKQGQRVKIQKRDSLLKFRCWGLLVFAVGTLTRGLGMLVP